MMSKFSSALVFGLVASSVANPILTRGKCPKELEAGDKDWCSGNSKDKIVIRVSNKQTNYGTLSPGKLMDSFEDKCEGGSCDESDWTLESEWQDDDGEGSPISGDVRIEVIDEVGIWRDFSKMRDALTKTLDEIKSTEKKKVQDYRNDGFDMSMTEREITETTGPASITIEQLSDAEGWPVKSSLTLKFKQEKDEEDNGDLCDSLMSVGQSVADVVNPVLGEAVGLASLACKFA